MALEPLKLDDLRWEEMVASVRAKIPGASQGQWTLHAAVDPGVTLLDLFAWMIEQRSFWLDQVPDELVRALLSLLGVEQAPAISAATALTINDTKPGRSYHELAAGSVFRLREPERSFTAQEGLTLLPVSRIEVVTPAGSVGGDLMRQRAVAVLPADGSVASFSVVLWIDQALPMPRPTAEMTLLLDLDAAPQIEPQWSPDAPDEIQPPAALTWTYSGAAGEMIAFDPASVHDGTGGLRRSGVVRLPIADGWVPIGPPDSTGALPHAIGLSTEASTYTYPPRLAQIAANALVASHFVSVEVAQPDLAEQALRWLKLPGQQLQLDVEQPPPIAPSVELRLLERDGWREWASSSDFSFSIASDRVFLVDREHKNLQFGDGLTGRVPVPQNPDAPQLEIRYRAGGGEEGNLGADLNWESVNDFEVKAANPVVAIGGTEAESVHDAAARAAAELAQRRRAVTKADYEELSVSTPGVSVARAWAAVGYHPLHPCVAVPGAVTVFLVPYAPRPVGDEWRLENEELVVSPVPDPGLLGEVAVRLDAARMVTSEVFVRAPRYRSVEVAVSIAGQFVDGGEIEREIGDRLARFLDPLVGGESGAGWPFGDAVRPSALVEQVQEVLGHRGQVAGVAVGLDGDPAEEDCQDLEIGPFDLVYLNSFGVRFTPKADFAGGMP